MEEKPFRVLLDFSEINTRISELKYVWMHISPRELKTINDFKNAIVRKFSFTQENFRLFVRDGLLLETEKIAILREDDTVKIQLEDPYETSLECRTEDTDINISLAEASSHSLSGKADSLKKSRKRKSETFVAACEENIDNFSTTVSKKKKKHDKTVCESDKSIIFSESHDLLPENLPSLDKNSKSNISLKKDKIKQQTGSKKKSYHKTPTSDFIAFAIKLSDAERHDQNDCQTNINDANSKRVECSVSDSNLYKTADLVSKTNVSPIPEKSTYVISSNPTVSNLTESLNNSESQVDDQNFKKNSCKKRRRKRRHKETPSTEDFSTDGLTEMETSFLADVTFNETYNTPSIARKHIIFDSPTPPKSNKSVNFDNEPSSSSAEAEVLPIKNLKSNYELDSLKNKSFKKDTRLDAKFEEGESVISEISDFKESTPFSKEKLKEKSWGVTPLPKISSNSSTFSVENSGVSSTNVKPTYQDYTPLNCLPPVGTHLAYKTLELNEDYCPEVTEYKEGILRKVDPNTDELEIELIQEEIKPGKTGKFENLWKDEPPPDGQVIKMVSLNWTALIEPRLIP